MLQPKLIMRINLRARMLFLTLLAEYLAGKMKISHLNNFNFFTPEIPFTPLNSLNRHLWRFGLKACLFLLTLTLLACGQESGTKGSYQADLVFPDDVPRLAETSQIDCTAARIANINFDFIINGEQSQIYTFPCEKHNALIQDVPVGTGITVEVFADDINGDALLEGSQLIDITKDKVNTGETIQMQYVPPVTDTDTDTETITDTDTETITETDTETITDTDTDTDVANFSGRWRIRDTPLDECWILTRYTEYTSTITQTGTYATISTDSPDISADPINSRECTVNGNLLSCIPFDFIGDRGYLHTYNEFTLTLSSNNNDIYGSAVWVVSNTETQARTCTGSSSLVGWRLESTGGTGE